MFDAKKFIKDQFGGARQLHQALVESGFKPPEIDSVSKWERRDSIPGHFLAASLTLLEERYEGAVSVSEYMKKRTTRCPNPRTTRALSTGELPDVFG